MEEVQNSVVYFPSLFINIKEKDFKATIDTGACTNFLSNAICLKARLVPVNKSRETTVELGNGQSVTVKQQAKANFTRRMTLKYLTQRCSI